MSSSRWGRRHWPLIYEKQARYRDASTHESGMPRTSPCLSTQASSLSLIRHVDVLSRNMCVRQPLACSCW